MILGKIINYNKHPLDDPNYVNLCKKEIVDKFNISFKKFLN